MKLTEFRELCDREWGEGRGDVIGLCLTDESLAELIRCVLKDAPGDPFRTLAGALPLREVVNPVTRSLVKLAGGADTDTAEVRRHYGSEMAPVPVGPRS